MQQQAFPFITYILTILVNAFRNSFSIFVFLLPSYAYQCISMFFVSFRNSTFVCMKFNYCLGKTMFIKYNFLVQFFIFIKAYPCSYSPGIYKL